MKPTQSLLILADDTANIDKIAAGIKGIPGVKQVRIGTFRHEHASTRQVDLFIQRPARIPAVLEAGRGKMGQS